MLTQERDKHKVLSKKLLCAGALRFSFLQTTSLSSGSGQTAAVSSLTVRLSVTARGFTNTRASAHCRVCVCVCADVCVVCLSLSRTTRLKLLPQPDSRHVDLKKQQKAAQVLPLLNPEPELLCLLAGVRCSPPRRVSRLVGVSVTGVAGSERLLPGSLAESCGEDSIHAPETVPNEQANSRRSGASEQREKRGCWAAVRSLL